MQQELAVVKAIQEIIKKNKKLRSLTPPKRPIILNKLKQRGYVSLNILELTRIINAHFKN